MYQASYSRSAIWILFFSQAILKIVHLIYLDVNEEKLANGSGNIDNDENIDEGTELLS